MQAAGHRVGLAVELSARVQHGENDLDRRLLLGRVHVDRHAAPVVDDPDSTVGQQGDLDTVAESGQSLVDGVVHHLPHEVVQSALAGGPDVHTGSLAYGFEPFQNGDRTAVIGRVVSRLLRRCRCCRYSRLARRFHRRTARCGHRSPSYAAIRRRDESRTHQKRLTKRLSGREPVHSTGSHRSHVVRDAPVDEADESGPRRWIPVPASLDKRPSVHSALPSLTQPAALSRRCPAVPGRPAHCGNRASNSGRSVH